MTNNKNIKKIFMQFLLCVYVLALVRPLAPAVNDFLGHHFWKTEHLSTVHYENGKYHLHIELAKNANENRTERPGNTSQGVDEFLASHLKSEKLLFEAYTSIASLIPLPEVQQPVDILIQAVIPPPEA